MIPGFMPTIAPINKTLLPYMVGYNRQEGNLGGSAPSTFQFPNYIVPGDFIMIVGGAVDNNPPGGAPAGINYTSVGFTNFNEQATGGNVAGTGVRTTAWGKIADGSENNITYNGMSGNKTVNYVIIYRSNNYNRFKSFNLFYNDGVGQDIPGSNVTLNISSPSSRACISCQFSMAIFGQIDNNISQTIGTPDHTLIDVAQARPYTTFYDNIFNAGASSATRYRLTDTGDGECFMVWNVEFF